MRRRLFLDTLSVWMILSRCSMVSNQQINRVCIKFSFSLWWHETGHTVSLSLLDDGKASLHRCRAGKKNKLSSCSSYREYHEYIPTPFRMQRLHTTTTTVDDERQDLFSSLCMLFLLNN